MKTSLKPVEYSAVDALDPHKSSWLWKHENLGRLGNFQNFMRIRHINSVNTASLIAVCLITEKAYKK